MSIEKKFRRLPWAIVFAEEMAEKLKRELREEISHMIPHRMLITQPPIDLKDYTIYGQMILLDYKGKGLLREVSIVSPSKEFEVAVYIDGAPYIRGTYEELERISMNIIALGAYPQDGKYNVNIKNFWFRHSARVILNVLQPPITFDKIFILYDVEVEA